MGQKMMNGSCCCASDAPVVVTGQTRHRAAPGRVVRNCILHPRLSAGHLGKSIGAVVSRDEYARSDERGQR